MMKRLPLLLFFLVFLLYSPTVAFNFVWDDSIYIVKNESLKSWSNFTSWWTQPKKTWSGNSDNYLAAWRPIRNISYAADYSLYKLTPSGWHLTNILLHALSAVLLFSFLKKVFRSLSTAESTRLTLAAFFGALLWAVHPVQTEIAAWVKSRDDLLCAVFFLAALLFLDPTPGKASPGKILAGYLCFLLALFSKENAIVLVALIPLTALALASDKIQVLKSRTFVFNSLAIGGLGLTFLALRDILLSGTAQSDYLAGNFRSMMFTMLTAVNRYYSLILWPFPPNTLVADYDAFSITKTLLAPTALSGLAITLCITAVSFTLRKKIPLIIYGWLFCVIAMLPFLNIIPMMQVMAERFLYFPLIGIAVMVGGVILKIPPRYSKHSFILLSLLSVAFAAQTLYRMQVWKDNLTLHSATMVANPVSWRPANNTVNALLTAKETTSALQLAEQNLRKWPYDPDIIYSAALSNYLSGNLERAAQLRDVLIQHHQFFHGTTVIARLLQSDENPADK